MILRLVFTALAAAVTTAACQSTSLQSQRTELAASLQNDFKTLDYSADGSISEEEWIAVLQVELSSSSDPSLTANSSLLLQAHRHMFNRLDQDADGKLSLAEFLSEPLRVFDCLDRDANGLISQEEDLTAPECELEDESDEAAE